jgi:hypothetical protein
MFVPSAMHAALSGEITELVFHDTQVAPPNGIPSEMCGANDARLYQNKIWTRSGVPRKMNRYSEETVRVAGLVDSRINASTVPSATPIAIPINVSSSVRSMPIRMVWTVR